MVLIKDSRAKPLSISLVVLALAGGACAPAGHGYFDAPNASLAGAHLALSQAQALAMLSGANGPKRFAKVNQRLYRGAQPGYLHLGQLKALGVKKIITFCKEDSKLRKAERRRAQALGMTFVEFPFYGLFGAERKFVDKVLSEMVEANGSVYVHGQEGRDRTSLMVGLYRVKYEGWEPRTAWQEEVLKYGWDASLYSQGIRDTFFRLAPAYQKESREQEQKSEQVATSPSPLAAPVAPARMKCRKLQCVGQSDL